MHKETETQWGQNNYQNTRNMLRREWKKYWDIGQQRAWFERVCVDWLDMIHMRCEDEGKKQAYRDCLQEHIPEGVTDEDYVELVLRIQNKQYLPACMVCLTRDILSRKLQLDRNSARVRELLSWSMRYAGEEQRMKNIWKKIPFELAEIKVGIQMLAETLLLTGEVTQQELLSEVEKSILSLAEQELIGRCIKSGMLVKEKAEEYIAYALYYGNRSVLPVLTALKFRE